MAFATLICSGAGLYAIHDRDGFGFITRDGEVAILPRFRHVWGFSEGLCAVQIDDSLGYIDGTGALVVSNRYQKAEDHRGGRALVERDGKYGYIDRQGRERIELAYEDAWPFDSGHAAVAVRDGGKTAYGIIDVDGHYVVEPRYQYIGPFSSGVAVYRHRGLWGLLSASGDVLVEAQFTAEPGRYASGLSPLADADGKWGYIGLRGTFAIPPRFHFSEGLGHVELDNGLHGYVDSQGHMVIAAGFEDAFPFSEGLAAVKRGGRFGFIGRDGEWVIPAQFLEALPFKQGLALVSFEEKRAYVTKSGHVVWEGENR